MRSIKFNLSAANASAWDGAVTLTEAYLTENLKANQLLERLPEGFTGERRATCQSLFLGALRHGQRVQQALQPFLRRDFHQELINSTRPASSRRVSRPVTRTKMKGTRYGSKEKTQIC